jgi:hypothetical protein
MITWEIDIDGVMTIWRDGSEIVKVALPSVERANMILSLAQSLKNKNPARAGVSI